MISSRPFSAVEVAWIAVILGVTNEVDLEQLRRGMTVELEHGRRDPLGLIKGQRRRASCRRRVSDVAARRVPVRGCYAHRNAD